MRAWSLDSQKPIPIEFLGECMALNVDFLQQGW